MKDEQKSHGRVRLFPGIWVALGVLVLLVARWSWGWIHSPRGIEKLAKELSSMFVIQKPIVVNQAGNLIAVIHTTEHGEGVFIKDVSNHVERKLCEVADVDYKASVAWLFGWSPDDKTLAYSWDYTLHFVRNDGQELSGNIPFTNRVQSFAWLSPETCVYIDEAGWLRQANLMGGKWTETDSWLLPGTNGPPRLVQAMGTNAVAWLTGNMLWRTDVSSGESEPLYSDFSMQMDSISYSVDGRSFLIAQSARRRRIYSLVLVSAAEREPGAKELLIQKEPILNAQWLNKGRSFAYLSQSGENTVLIGKRQLDASGRIFFRSGDAKSLFCDGQGISAYAVGSGKTCEPAGVWRCNVDSGDADRVLSPGGGRENFPYRPVLTGGVTFGNRHYESFDVVPPAHFSRHRRYPLVIGLGGYEWTPIAHATYAQCLANSGVYVAFVNYRFNHADPKSIRAYTNQFMAVYNQLAGNPNVDTNRVYLFAFSAGTAVIDELVHAYPGQWRGIMLLSGGVLPHAKAGMTERVLALAGSGEGQEERFQRYQEDLAKVGIPLEWHVHEDAQHVVRDQTAMYERTLWMANMVFE